MTATTSGSATAVRTPWGGYWKWVGTANGVSVELITSDPDLHLSAEALSTDKLDGVALIDERRQVHATQFRPAIPPRYVGMASGDVS